MPTLPTPHHTQPTFSLSLSLQHSDPIANARGDEGGGQLEIERRRLDKVRRRQQKEIEQMLAFEMKMAQIQEGANAKLEVEAKKNLLRLKEEKMRQKKMQQGKRMKSMKKQAEMELEEKRRRQLAHRAYVKDAQLEEERKRKAVELKRHAKQVEVDRQRKAEEHKLQVRARGRGGEVEGGSWGCGWDEKAEEIVYCRSHDVAYEPPF